MSLLIVNFCMVLLAACADSGRPSEVSNGAQLSNGDQAISAPVLARPGAPQNVRVLPQLPPARQAAPLPKEVYEQWANPSVRVINMPAGTYYLPGDAPLRLHRSNVTVNFAGSTLVVNPADAVSGSYPIQISSVSRTTPINRASKANDPGTRALSHLSGDINASTTRLTMDPAEVVDLIPGEQVMIHAGVSASDPYEAQEYIVATVGSVSRAGEITFTAPLGKDIIDYRDAAGLRAAAAPGQADKVGIWGSYPDSSNFAKGYGTDHGLERFVGGVVHDVTFNDLHMVLDRADRASALIPNTMWEVSTIAVQNFTMNRTTIENPCGSSLHLWRSFNTLIDGYTVVGAGIAKIWNTSTFASPAISIWGGDGMTFRNMAVSGTNMTAFSVEVGARNIWVDGLNYSGRFTAARDYTSSDVVLGFFSVQGPVRLTNATLSAVTTGGAEHTIFGYSSMVSDGFLRFPGPWLTSTFDFGYQKHVALQGTVTIGGVTYGPPVTEVRSYELEPGGSRRVKLPRGIYTAATLQLDSAGDVRDIYDSFGNRYTPQAFSGGQIELTPNKWLQIEAGPAALKSYVEKDIEFNQPGDGTNPATVKFTVTYLPALGGSTNE